MADEELRIAAGKAISDGLRKGGTFKVLFFVTQETGRVNQQDATTLRLVLEAAPEIGMDYGIIVNKVSQGILKKLIGRKNDFINTLFAGIPKGKRCVYSNIFFLEKKRELEDEEDQFLSADEFKNETGLHVLAWQSCWSRVSKGQFILKCLFGVIVSKYQKHAILLKDFCTSL